MSLFYVLSGKVSKVNYLRKKVADEDLAKIKEGLGQEPGDILLGLAGIFASQAIYELFNPNNNILIKYVKDMDENDMHSLFCVLIAHALFRFSTEYRSNINMDIDYIAKRLEIVLDYTKTELHDFFKSEMLWNIDPNNKIAEFSPHSPTVKLIIHYSHADFHPIRDKNIIAVLVNSYNFVKKDFDFIK
jgi:hypothetical protein